MSYTTVVKKYPNFPKEYLVLYFETRGFSHRVYIEKIFRDLFSVDSPLQDIILTENIDFRIFRDCIDSIEYISERQKSELYNDMELYINSCYSPGCNCDVL